MSKRFPHPFKQMLQQYKNYRRRLPKLIEGLALAQFKTNFQRQGYIGDSGVVKWAPRKTKSRKDNGRAILVKSGRLKRSLRGASDLNTVRIATDVPYARKHNEGFTGVEFVKPHKSQRKGKRFNVKGFSRKMKVKARPFMIWNKTLERDINKMVDKDLGTIFNNIKP